MAGLGQLGAVGLQEGGGELQRVQVQHQVRAQLPVTQPGAGEGVGWHPNRRLLYLKFSCWNTKVGRMNCSW